jgi:hypothetical protein
MSNSPSSVPQSPISRSIALPISFAACGALLLVMLVVLVGCGGAPFESLPDPVTPNAQNAVLCTCDCQSPDPTGPSSNVITAGPDDAAQAFVQSTAVLDSSVLELGQQGHVGLRFQKLGVPQGATITSAHIQFTAAVASTANNVADLQIRVVDSPNAGAFTMTTDLKILPVTNASVAWQPDAWQLDEALDNEKTPDLTALLQSIVDDVQYTPDSAVAFIITGSGRRTARSLEGSVSTPAPAALVIGYTPKVTTQEFLACHTAQEQPATVCEGRVQDGVTALASACQVGTGCTCKVKEGVESSSFSSVCNAPCPTITPPADCNPEDFAKATAATANLPAVCIGNSPLGSALFARLSACELDPNQSRVDVTVKDEDGDVEGESGSHVRGRVEFSGTPCPRSECAVGMTHRMRFGDLRFDGGVFGSDPVFTQLTGVGKSKDSEKAELDAAGTGAFGPGSTDHSARGHQVDGETQAFFSSNTAPMNVSVGGWEPGGVCTLSGNLVQTDRLIMSASLRGTLVNQPPTAMADPARAVECNRTGRASFTLDASVDDPDNNVAFFGWFKGSRTGPLVGTLPKILLEQDLGGPVTWVFKVIDTFGQYDEAATAVTVEDTTPPVIGSVTASPNRLWAPNHQLVPVTVSVPVSDICDAAPTCKIIGVSSNEPINGPGDGNTAPDWVITGALTVDLRSERSGTGTGRVYLVQVQCTDSSGNSATKAVSVSVPKSQGKS